jgi:hypothetical protein
MIFKEKSYCNILVNTKKLGKLAVDQGNIKGHLKHWHMGITCVRLGQCR